MKTTTTLLIALGLACSAALAQTQSSPSAGGVQTDSRAGEQSQYSIGSGTGASPALQSGAPSGGGTLDTQSGPQSGMPPHPSSGTSGTQSGMPPPTGPDTSGAQPGTPPMAPSSASGASGTLSDSQPGMPPPASGAQPGAGASSMQSSEQSQAGGGDLSPMARLQAKTENGVTYVCGGVGKEEQSYMKREARKHDMLMTFAAKDGEFIADVNVAIKDTKGNAVLETTCDGPMMLVDLPKSGKYHVHAVANGHAIDRTVTVAKGPGKKAQQVATVSLTWPTQVAQIDPTEATTATGAGDTGGASRAGGGSRDEKKR